MNDLILDIIDFADIDDDWERDLEIEHMCAKLRATAHLHARSIEAEAELWERIVEDERTDYGTPIGGARSRGLH